MDPNDLYLFSSQDFSGKVGKDPRDLKRGDRVDFSGGRYGTVHGIHLGTNTATVSIQGVGMKEISLYDLS